MRSAGLTVHEVKKPVHFGDGVTYQVFPHLLILPNHSLQIVFTPQAPDMPRVWATGPECDAHRNPDGSLCLWYPKDSASRRWTRNDGGKMLLGIVVRHLRWEAIYLRTGVWPGFEAPHGDLSPGVDERGNIVG